jgi:transposase-like protein
MKRRVRRGDPQRQSYWEAVVQRWREGGQRVRAFCRAEGLRESAFYFWRRQLARRGRQAAVVNGSQPQARAARAASRSSKGILPQPDATPSFLPVRVVAPTSVCAGVAEAGHPLAGRGVEIVLPQGRTVRAPVGFDRQTLVDVLAVLEARPC